MTYKSERIDRVVWQAQSCIATSEDLRFVAADGRRVMVLHPALDPHAWQVAPVVELFQEGERFTRVRAAAILEQDDLAKQVAGRVYWTEGAGGEPGPQPTLNARGDAVVFTRVDNVPMQVDFEGRVSRVEAPIERTVARGNGPAAQNRQAIEDAASRQQSLDRENEALRAAWLNKQQDAAAYRPPAGPTHLERDIQMGDAAWKCQNYGICENHVSEGRLDESSFGVQDTRTRSMITHDDDRDRNLVPKPSAR